ncbi:hypothetical protein ACNSTU_00295 [Aquisalimonas sp. APHAB1-3]|uniref:hypothetical protein n=1 Tax=Aquisalimonas sp. APHAB1-3 TaxID=3402080 RepID=UPI003AAF9DCC
MERVNANPGQMYAGLEQKVLDASLRKELRGIRARVIHLLDQQLAYRPGTGAWRKALEHLERVVGRGLRLEDDLLRGKHFDGYREGDGDAWDLCADVGKLRGRLPQLFHEAREANPDTAFMAYLRLSASLRRWAGCIEAKA